MTSRPVVCSPLRNPGRQHRSPDWRLRRLQCQPRVLDAQHDLEIDAQTARIEIRRADKQDVVHHDQPHAHPAPRRRGQHVSEALTNVGITEDGGFHDLGRLRRGEGGQFSFEQALPCVMPDETVGRGHSGTTVTQGRRRDNRIDGVLSRIRFRLGARCPGCPAPGSAVGLD